MKFGEYLKGIRRKLGVSQVKFGKKLGVPQSTISRWETEPDPKLSVENALLLAHKLGEAPDVILEKIGRDDLAAIVGAVRGKPRPTLQFSPAYAGEHEALEKILNAGGPRAEAVRELLKMALLKRNNNLKQVG